MNLFLPDNIYVRFANTVYGQVVGIPVGTNYAPLTDLFVYSYKSQFMAKLSKDPSKN